MLLNESITKNKGTRVSKYISLVPFVAVVFAAAASGSLFMPGGWYEALNKPAWTPPNWVFPVVWSVLYVMIVIAGWLVWRRAGWSSALAVWGIGLVLNALWSYLMFGRHEIGLALADSVALWLSIAAFIGLAWHLDRVAAYLFVPYLAWVSVATFLNFTIWRINS